MLNKPLGREYTLFEIMKRPEIKGMALLEAAGLKMISSSVAEQIEIDCKYEGYISRQEKEVEKTNFTLISLFLQTFVLTRYPAYLMRQNRS